MNKFSLILILYSLLGVPAHAHELGVFGKPRPAVSLEADEKVKDFRKMVLVQSKDQLEKEMRNLCPKEYAVIDRIYARILKSSPIQKFLVAPYEPAIICWCDLKDDKSGMGTGFRLNGELQIAGSYIGKATSEDSIAFVLAHELSHFLYAHDEEQSEEIIDRRATDKGYRVDHTAQEKLADESSLELMSRAGYNPKAALDAIGIMGVESGECLKIFGRYICPGSRSQTDINNHGTAAQRIRRVKNEVASHQYVKQKLTHEESLKEAQIEWNGLVSKF